MHTPHTVCNIYFHKCKTDSGLWWTLYDDDDIKRWSWRRANIQTSAKNHLPLCDCVKRKDNNKMWTRLKLSCECSYHRDIGYVATAYYGTQQKNKNTSFNNASKKWSFLRIFFHCWKYFSFFVTRWVRQFEFRSRFSISLLAGGHPATASTHCTPSTIARCIYGKLWNIYLFIYLFSAIWFWFWFDDNIALWVWAVCTT